MKRKVISDLVLNIIANFLPMFVLQFIILPRISLELSADSYGLLLTIVAFIYLTSSSFGSVLNNSRLIHNKKYIDLDIVGDYKIFLIYFCIFNTILMIFGLFFIGSSFDMLSNISFIIISTLSLINTYVIVEFRINLDFKSILINNIYVFFGYLFGYQLFIISGIWHLVYLLGFGFGFVHLLMTTHILKETKTKTVLYQFVKKETLILLFSGILTSLGVYIDKLIIYPLLGGHAVAIYNTSSLLGKTISLAIVPVTGVLLSYLSRLKNFKSNNFKMIIMISILAGTIGYISIIFISKPLLELIYPQYVNEALKYIPITTLTIIITIINNLINPFLLSFLRAKWQLILSGLHMTIYVFASLILLKFYGLFGFCIGILISYVVRLFLMILIYFRESEFGRQKIKSEVQ